VLADLADFCLAVEHVTWVVVASLLDDELVLTLRYSGRGAGAGTVARASRGAVAVAAATRPWRAWPSPGSGRGTAG
jgi:hypothetical protein